jgi:hypothetical protein
VAVSEWAPTTEAEIAMRDALRAGDQELYFRILARTELLLPVSSDALAGRTTMGWGTWTTNGRTHVLAFTSSEALRACLAEHAGSARRMPYHELAGSWPNLDWWLAVNPGLPIEGYLPAWFVSQLARGDVRLPGRSLGAAARLERPGTAGRARATAAVPLRTVPRQTRPEPPEEAPAGGRVRPGANGMSGRPTVAPPLAGSPGTAAPAAAGANGQPAFAGAELPIDQPIASRGVGASARATVPAPQVSPGPQPAVPETSSRAAVEPSRALAEPSGAAAEPLPISDPLAALEPLTARRPPTDPESPPTSASAPEPASRAPDAPTLSRTTSPVDRVPPPFEPANDVEESLLAAAGDGNTDSFLSTLLLARVLVPRQAGATAGVRPGDPGFAWRTELIDGDRYVVVFTSHARLTEHMTASATADEAGDAVPVRFVRLIRAWPDKSWSFAVNPGSPVGATLPGDQIVALASWAAEVGLGDDEDDQRAEQPIEAAPAAQTPAPPPERPRPTMMQKAVAPTQVTYYLERGYDRVSGFVHRVDEVAHLKTPAKLHVALGLGYPNSPFSPDAPEVYALRWPAYRPSLYRIPYGGQTEAAMRAMEGWVIERPPFRGNGFAPGDSSDVIAEFKVDSVRLPHGAQLWRVTPDGADELVAVLDADGPIWRPVVEP